jgi:transposase
MLSLPANVRLYLCTTPTDMRKSFDGLHTLVRQVFQLDPLDGHLFLFVNRRGDRVKILWWDRDGLALFYKRLEAGTYQLPVVTEGVVTEGAQGVEIDATQLALLLGGVDLQSAKRRKRYSRVA